MIRSIFMILAALLAAIFVSPASAQEPVRGTVSAELQAFVRTSYIFEFADSVSPGQARGRAAALVRGANGTLDNVYTFAPRGFSARMGAVAADNLFRNNDDVVGYRRDGIVSIAQSSKAPGGTPRKPGKGGGGGSATTPQEVPWGIARVGGGVTLDWAAIGKTAWVIDTGVDQDHLDLNVDTSRSISFVLTGKDPESPDDQNGHGTHVAGTIAAIDNNRDVIGVAAGAPVVSVRVLDRRGSGAWSWVLSGIEYVGTSAKPGDVANMSLGGGFNSDINAKIETIATEKGVLFALAAGNEATNAGTRSPASAGGTKDDSLYDGKIYTVSAIDVNDEYAYFSNYGNPPVDVAAPGVDVKSLWKNGGTNTISGTSMAAPHVAGLLLLGSVSSDGKAKNDPDGDPDPIAHH